METKKDALTGVRLGAPARALACALTIALSAGMAPAGALAYAAEGEGAPAAAQGATEKGASASATAPAGRVSEDVALDTSGGTSSIEGEGGPSGSADAAAGAEAGSSGGAAADTPTKYTSSASGQTSADVSLSGSATVGTIEYNGLAYTIDADDPATVALTGLASTAPKGDLVIPSQIACGDKLYKVAKIARGGGYLR